MPEINLIKDPAEVERLAARLGMSPEDFENSYVSVNDWHDRVISQKPCLFLEGCLCSVYEDRPTDCREYPHLMKEDMRSHSLGLITNASYCPIIFNTLEVLKRRLRWKRR